MRHKLFGIGMLTVVVLGIAFLVTRRSSTAIVPQSPRPAGLSLPPVASVDSPSKQWPMRQGPRAARPVPGHIEPEIATQTTIRFPVALPHTPEVDELLEKDGASDDRYMLDYLLGMYAFVDGCTGRRIQHGSLSYFLHWMYDDDGIGRSAGFSLTERFPPQDISEDDVKLFAACVDTYMSSHDVPLPDLSASGPMAWAEQARFPLENQPLVKFALKHTNSSAGAP
jgi:hypothetical protein